MANRRLEEVCGDYVHDNPGTHLHGGIGEEMNTKHISYLNRLIPYSFSVIRPPNDKIGKAFVNKLANLINGLLQRDFNLEYIPLFMILMTYKVPDCTSASNIKKLMKDRLERFEDPSKLGQLVSKA